MENTAGATSSLTKMRTVNKRDIQGQFTMMFILGEGTYGKVIKAIDHGRNKLVAIKIIDNCFEISNKNKLSDHSAIKNEIIEEIEALRSLQHKNIVRLEDCFICDNKVYLVIEYCTNGSIAQHKMRINEQVLLAIIRDVANALKYVHEQNSVHCDVKPQNILLTNTCDVRLADFGISIVQTRNSDALNNSRGATNKKAGMNESRGTALYMAPEVSIGLTPSPKSDIYSLGMTMFEMASGLPLGLTLSKTFDDWIANNEAIFPNGDQWSPKLTNLIRKMLCSNPDERPTTSDVVAEIGCVGETWILASQRIKPDTSILN